MDKINLKSMMKGVEPWQSPQWSYLNLKNQADLKKVQKLQYKSSKIHSWRAHSECVFRTQKTATINCLSPVTVALTSPPKKRTGEQSFKHGATICSDHIETWMHALGSAYIVASSEIHMNSNIFLSRILDNPFCVLFGARLIAPKTRIRQKKILLHHTF